MDYIKAVREINFAIGILINNSSADIVTPYIIKAKYYCGNINNINEDCELLKIYNENYEKSRKNK
jgi:hypothetical protein